MKVALLCISLEPGRDGVGDYVRRFAQALTSRGHVCQVVALADRFASRCMNAIDPEYGFQVVRLPQTDWQRGEISFAVEQLSRFQPDWASLQMVCYGFERQGMLWSSARRFARLRLAPRRHMMFHELWIGAWCSSSRKERAIGWLQERLLMRAVRAWSPQITHTSNPLYREMLRRAKVAAGVLTIPSNIPVHELDQGSTRAMLERRLPLGSDPAAKPLLGGLFGHLPPELAAGEWLGRLTAACGRVERELVIVQLGRPGPGGADLIAALRRRTAGRVRFLELGELPASEVSAVLQGLDFGIATAPWSLIGKSGTAAAMLQHGLPILVPREGDSLRGGSMPPPWLHPQLFRLGDLCAALESGTLLRAPLQSRVEVYEQFIGALERAS
jgi:hypothetical protein